MRPSSGRQTVGLRPLWRPFLLRGLPLLAAFLAGFVGLMSGVEVTERELAAASMAERAYYALGLFVLGGLDIGTPVGGPPVGRFLLWTAYFSAPLITASALLEAVVRVVSPLAFRARALSDHVVLAGGGRLTRLYVRRLRQTDPERTVVVVERDANQPLLGELRDVYRATIVQGDITSDEVLGGLRLEAAHRVLLLTGDDFANLDGASKIVKMAPNLAGRIVVHVSDLGFMRETAESSVAKVSEIFNAHQFAAQNLVQEHLLERFRDTPEEDLVVLAGFGRFGQTVLHDLQQHAAGSFGRVVIVDTVAEQKARAFEDQPGFASDYERTILDGDILDPAIWRQIGDIVRSDGHEPVIIVGSGSEGLNLHAALLARKQHPEALVIVRSFRASPFTDEIAGEVGVHSFNLAGLIGDGMPKDWF